MFKANFRQHVYVLWSFVSNKLSLPEVDLGPGQFTKFSEACRNDVHSSSCNMDSMVTSYAQYIDFCSTNVKLVTSSI